MPRDLSDRSGIKFVSMPPALRTDAVCRAWVLSNGPVGTVWKRPVPLLSAYWLARHWMATMRSRRTMTFDVDPAGDGRSTVTVMQH